MFKILLIISATMIGDTEPTTQPFLIGEFTSVKECLQVKYQNDQIAEELKTREDMKDLKMSFQSSCIGEV